ncbi:hypothetical protein IKE98_00855 [Candidatus Saccharibacteria bacterium]|nr:hypothetical protein [Candidatus Saccharibacteria bacterium]
MSKKLLKIIMPAVLLLASLASFCPVAPTLAAKEPNSNVCNLDVPKSVKEAAGCNNNADKVPGIVIGIINAVISVLGLVAVVFIIIGGISYMTSSGEAAKVEKARKTILYAVIGLAICVLAFAIVNFAVGIINSPPTS